MTDSHNENTSLLILFGLIGAMVAFAVLLLIGANLISALALDDDLDSRAKARIAERLKPVGDVRVGDEPAPSATASRETAKEAAPDPAEIVNNACVACHGSGVMNAPVMGKAGDWEPRLQDKGFSTLVENAVNGINAMPPKGGDPSLSEEAIEKAVRYMLEESGLNPS